MSEMHVNTQRETGAVLVWVALTSLVLLSVAALAVDLGWAYAVKRQLSSTADAVALAGAQEAGLKYRSTLGCVSDGNGGYEPHQTLIDVIQQAVTETHNDNSPAGSIGAPTPTVTCTPTEVTVSVIENSTLNSFFGRIMGIDTLRPAAAATANLFGGKEQAGLRPFTVCITDATLGSVEGTTGYPTMDSIYASANGDGTEDLISGGGSAWAAVTGIVTTSGNHGLSQGDYVRLDVTSGATGATEGFYFVRSTSGNRTFTLSAAPTTNPVQANLVAPPINGVVDVFKQTLGLIGGGTSQWNSTTGLVTTTGNHQLDVGDFVEIWSTTNGSTDGVSPPERYYVGTTPSNRTFTLTLPPDNLTSPSDLVFVYKKDPNAPVNTSSCSNSTSTGAPANWGYARFDLSGNQPTLLCLIQYGYGPDCGSSAAISLGDEAGNQTSPGNTGNSLQVPAGQGGQQTSDLLAYLNSIVDETILLPVADTWYEQGQNANYRAFGGLPVVFCGFVFPRSNNDPTPSAEGSPQGSCWKPEMYTAAVDAERMDGASLYIQWMRAPGELVTNYVGQSDDPEDRCILGRDTCIATLRLIK